MGVPEKCEAGVITWATGGLKGRLAATTWFRSSFTYSRGGESVIHRHMSRPNNSPNEPGSAPEKPAWARVKRNTADQIDAIVRKSGESRDDVLDLLLRKGLEMAPQSKGKQTTVIEKTIHHHVRNGDVGLINIKDSFNNLMFKIAIGGRIQDGLTPTGWALAISFFLGIVALGAAGALKILIFS